MGQIAKSLGIGSQFEYQGAVYKVSPWTYKVLGEFEAYLENEALRNMRKMRPYLTDSEYQELARKTRQDLESGKYTFGSDTIKEHLNSMRHLIALTTLCVQKNHPEFQREALERMFDEDKEKFNEVIGAMFEANADPNAPRGEGTTSPTPTAP